MDCYKISALIFFVPFIIGSFHLTLAKLFSSHIIPSAYYQRLVKILKTSINWCNKIQCIICWPLLQRRHLMQYLYFVNFIHDSTLQALPHILVNLSSYSNWRGTGCLLFLSSFFRRKCLPVLLVVQTSLQELNESTILAIAVGKGPINEIMFSN